MTDDIAYLPATELLKRYRDKSLSPVEVAKAAIERLEKYESAINAFVLYDPETALDMARASEARWRKGEPQGLVDGLPVGLKDTVSALGWPRRIGSRTTPDAPSVEDAPVVARLRAEGAVFFGKTTTPEFGWKPLTDSPLSGITRNPWNVERTPGGSSGGSAAALAAGICPLAVGTDAGGSIRIPASFCGLVGLKPTFGRVAVYPASMFGDVAHVGPMARNTADAALMLDAIKGPDARDWASLPDDGIAYREATATASLACKRVALSPTLGYREPTPAVRAAVEQAARVFEELGAIVEPADPFAEDPGPVFGSLALALFWAMLQAQPPEAVPLMDPGLVAAARHGESVTLAQYLDAQVKRAALGQRVRLFFERFDLLLSPTMTIPAAYAEPRDDDQPNPNNFQTWMPYTAAFNMTKNPSASINCGFADGLPVGLQVTGPLWGDAAVLSACHAYETAGGLAWPSPDLTEALGRIARPADAGVRQKIRRQV